MEIPTDGARGCTYAEIGKTVSAVRWLWPGWLPCGHVTLFVGQAGDGKSAISLDLGGRFVTGEKMPDGYVPERLACVTWIDTEGAQSQMVERLALWGLPPERFTCPGGAADSLRDFAIEDAASMDDLLKHVRACGSRLIVIDSLRGSHSQDENSSERTGSVMKRLRELAQRSGCAVLVTHHTRKASDELDAPPDITLSSVRGSSVIIAESRSIWAIQPPRGADYKRLESIKSNFSAKPPTLAVRVIDAVEWPEVADTQPAPAVKRSPVVDAVAMLRDALSAGPQPANVIAANAKARGISEYALRTARKRLGVVATKSHVEDGAWVWSPPSPPSTSSSPSSADDGEGVEGCEDVEEGEKKGAGSPNLEGVEVPRQVSDEANDERLPLPDGGAV